MQGFEESRFPDGYPTVLEDYSWSVNDIAGPYKTYNKHCGVSDSFAESPYFMKNCVKGILDARQMNYDNDMLEFICKCFTVYYSEGEFHISQKKDKDGGTLFTPGEWRRICTLNRYEKKSHNGILKQLLQDIKDTYNYLLREE